MITYLKYFERSSCDLQQSGKPTLHLCYPFYFHLLAVSERNSEDSSLIKTFKKYCKENLIDKWKPELKIQHLTATFFYPSAKKLSVFSEQERQPVYEYIAKMYNKLKGQHVKQSENLRFDNFWQRSVTPSTSSTISKENLFKNFQNTININNEHLSTAARTMGKHFQYA